MGGIQRAAAMVLLSFWLSAIGCAGAEKRPDEAPPDTALPIEPPPVEAGANQSHRLEASADPEVALALRELRRSGVYNSQELRQLEETFNNAAPENRRLLVSMIREQHRRRSPAEGDTNESNLAASEPSTMLARLRDAMPWGPNSATDSTPLRRLPLPPRDRFAGNGALRDDYPRTGAAPYPELLARGESPREVAWPDAAPRLTERTDPKKPAPVVRAGYDRKNDAASSRDWSESLQEAIRSLEAKLADAPRNAGQAELHAQLRMLYLVADRREEALRPIPNIDAAEQDFWTKEVYGLAMLLDAKRTPDASKRASEANLYLREATTRLGEIGLPKIKNPAFCLGVQSYGVLERFKTDEFRPQQSVLLYAEIEDFKSRSTPEGYHTSLQGSYEIYDGRGQRVFDERLPLVEDTCQNRRRDFFVRYIIQLPERIYNGAHTLQLRIEDTHSGKFATASLDFSIKTK